MDEVYCMNTSIKRKYVKFPNSGVYGRAANGHVRRTVCGHLQPRESWTWTPNLNKLKFWKIKPEIIDSLSRLIQLLNTIIGVSTVILTEPMIQMNITFILIIGFKKRSWESLPVKTGSITNVHENESFWNRVHLEKMISKMKIKNCFSL